MAAPRGFSWRSLALVIAGGAIGVALRALIVAPLGTDGHPLVVPLATLAINLVGSFLLGAVVGRLGDRHPRVRTFFGSGVLGGFTTYSAFAVQTVTMGTDAPVIGVLLLVLALFGGVLAAVLGLRLGGRSDEIATPADVE